MHADLRRQQGGFTLVEIAIVLVIIGLILGGVLKGQELVTSARVRNIADQQNAIKAAFFAFQDRYKALPGDYSEASKNIPGLGVASGASGADGDGDGFIAYTAASPTAPSATETKEQAWAFLHLTAAGFISCSPCMTAGPAATAPSTSNSPVNAFGGVLMMAYDNNFGQNPGAAATNAANNVKTGSNIPSNILAEVDNKLDDGNPYTGTLQFSPYSASTVAPTAAACVTGTGAPYNWNRQTPSTNCGAAYTF
jgi:prepilin-type N-terminal cleavage/methylation domain-containing protein